MGIDNPLEEHPASVLQNSTSNGDASSSAFSQDKLTQMQKTTLEKAIRTIYKIQGRVAAHSDSEDSECGDGCLCEIEDDLEAVIRLLEKV
jgi:hypothetical protein